MRIFLTCILLEHLVAEYHLSSAARSFLWNLMSGGGFDEVYSIIPLFVCGEMKTFREPGNELIYSPLRRKEKVATKLAIFAEQVSVFLRIGWHDTLWLYSIGILNVLLVLLLMLFRPKVRICVIELDSAPPTRGFCVMSLHLYLLDHVDGMIRLTDSPLFTNKNSVCLIEVTPNRRDKIPLIKKPTMEFLLSGILQPDMSSLPLILDAFAKVRDCRLHITGTCDSKQLREYADKYPGIIYHSVLSFDAYLHLLHSATFRLSLRNPSWSGNQYNFLSKIIGAPLHNRIIISIIHYPQIEGIGYIETTRSENGFEETSRQIRSMQEEELMKYVSQSELVQQKFNPNVWNNWMTRIKNRSEEK